MKIELKRNRGYRWYRSDDVFAKGYIFDENGNVFENEELITFFNSISSVDQLQSLLLKTNGFFSVVLDTKTHIIAAVDRLRSIPLLYSEQACLITDDFSTFNTTPDDFSEDKEDEFLHAGFISGKYTLVDNIKQIQAGEIVAFEKTSKNISLLTYFELRHSNFSKSSQLQLIEDFDKLIDNVFRRYISLLNGRTVVVPLSAGYDSRLIVQKLYQLEYKNVICFSYGKKGNWESAISEKVANLYDYEWLFVEYTKNNLYDLYQNRIDDYIVYSTNHCSFAHTQDFLAVHKLKTQLPKNSVFMPGHTLDFLAGNQIPESFSQLNSISKIVREILIKHFSQMGSYDYIEKNITHKIKTQFTISTNQDLNFDDASSVFENWVWRERQSKYIVNSVRVYDYYDFEWMIPLWDNEIIDFWSSVPAKYRLKRKLFLSYATKKYDSKIPLNPRQPVTKKLINKLTDIWFSRFIENQHFFSLLTIKIKDIFPEFSKTFLNRRTHLVNFPKVGLNVLKMFLALKKLR